MLATTQGQQIDVIRRCGAVDVTHLDAVILSKLRGVHVRDRLIRDRSEETLQNGEFDDARVVARNLAFGTNLKRLWH